MLASRRLMMARPKLAGASTLARDHRAAVMPLQSERPMLALQELRPSSRSEPAMTDTADTARVVVRPPIAWALAVLVGLALDWLMPLPFMPLAAPARWLGGALFAVALALFVWAIVTFTTAGTHVPSSMPTTTIVDTGPYRFTRNPIYLAMFLGLVGLAVAFDSLWMLAVLVPFALVIRYGVVAREEAYLERKFGDVYRRYRSRVRRWL